MRGDTIEGYGIAQAVGETLHSQMCRGKLNPERLTLMELLLNVLLDEVPIEIP